MAVRSAQLAITGNLVGISNTVVATVPAGETWILKSVCFMHQAGPAGDVRIEISAGAGTTCSVAKVSLAVGQVEYLDRWVILEPGNTITFRVQTAATEVRGWVSGTMLLGVA